MDVSIIIPVYNLENYIVQCLDSIAIQNYDKEKFEIILVLDSCTDGTKSKIEAWQQAWPEVGVIMLEVAYGNAGQTRNAGLDAAKGQYIVFMDGDDQWLRADALSTLCQAAQEGTAVYEEKFQDNEGLRGTERNRDCVWRFLIPKSMIGNTRFPALPFNEDFAFIGALRRKVGIWKVNPIQDLLYHYNHPREGSISTEMLKNAKK